MMTKTDLAAACIPALMLQHPIHIDVQAPGGADLPHDPQASLPGHPKNIMLRHHQGQDGGT